MNATTPLHILTVENGIAGVTAGLRFDNEAWVGCMHSDEWKEKLGGFVRKERKA